MVLGAGVAALAALYGLGPVRGAERVLSEGFVALSPDDTMSVFPSAAQKSDRAASDKSAAQTEQNGIRVLREGESVKVELSPADALAIARELINGGQYDGAKTILAGLGVVPEDDIDTTERDFLLGLVALQQEDFATAEQVFRRILNGRPALVRVRLELARSLFGLRRDRAAAYHFRQALAGDLPEATRRNIRAFLAMIERRRVWSVNASTSIVPDTNVSAGPRNAAIDLMGLPFELNEDGLARSGVGLSSALNLGVFPRIAKHWRLEARASTAFTDYSNREFDDLNIAGEAGVRYEQKGLSASVLATAGRRVFGGSGFNRSVGGRAAVQLGLTRRTVAQLSGGGAHVRYDENPLRDGPVYYTGIGLQHAVDRRSRVRGTLTVTREQTSEPVLQNTTVQLRTGLQRELPWGVTFEAGPDIYFRRFDDPDALSPGEDPIRRRDWSYGATVNITKRDWDLYGFAPVITYQYLRNESTSDQFDFSRHRVNFGLTRTF